MLNLLNTRIYESVHLQIASGFDIEAEGVCLKFVDEGGVAKVRPSEGLAGENFAGVSLFHTVIPGVMPEYANYTIPDAPGPYVVTSLHTPIAGTVYVYDETDSAEIVAGSPANPGEYSRVNDTFTFNAAETGHIIRISYRFIPTIQEAIAYKGEGQVGVPVTGVTGVVGAIRVGSFDTSEYETNSTWTAGAPVRMGAGGLFTQIVGTNVLIPNSRVESVPGVTNQFLTISLM